MIVYAVALLFGAVRFDAQQMATDNVKEAVELMVKQNVSKETFHQALAGVAVVTDDPTQQIDPALIEAHRPSQSKRDTTVERKHYTAILSVYATQVGSSITQGINVAVKVCDEAVKEEAKGHIGRKHHVLYFQLGHMSDVHNDEYSEESSAFYIANYNHGLEVTN